MATRVNLEKAASTTRNNSVDLLRIVAMLMIISLHLIGHGGVLTSYDKVSFTQNVVLTFKSVCLVAVNCYILISGYFLVGSTFQVKKLLSLATQITFYSLGTYVLLVLLGLIQLSKAEYLQAVFPVFGGVYWFATAYVGLYVLSPYLNRFINLIDQKTHISLIVFLIAIFSAWPTLLIYAKGVALSGLLITNGYSIIWFIVLYFIAAYIRLYYKPTYKSLFYLRRYVAVAVVVALLSVASNHIGHSFENGYVLTLFNRLSAYNALTVLVPSVLLFIFFLNLKITSRSINTFITVLSPLTFGVYLIHDEPHIRKILWSFLDLSSHVHSYYFPLLCLAVIAAIYAACSCIDWCRAVVFVRVKETRLFKDISKNYQGLLTSLFQRALIVVDRVLRT